jgi:tRNA threonylcarbamoyladenosine biosynthesis protein TsaB
LKDDDGGIPSPWGRCDGELTCAPRPINSHNVIRLRCAGQVQARIHPRSLASRASIFVNLLVLDTSTSEAVLAACRKDGRIATATTPAANRHGRSLIPALRDLLLELEIAPSDLNAVGVGLGPGSYTGLRIGVTAAKTLAYATGATLIGLDTFEAIARNARADALHVSVVADAQRHELYVADFGRSAPAEPLRRLAPTRFSTEPDWIASLPIDSIAIGPGLSRVNSSIEPARRWESPAENLPRGERLLEMLRESLEAGPADFGWTLEPIYLRRSSAEDLWDKRPQAATTLKSSLEKP